MKISYEDELIATALRNAAQSIMDREDSDEIVNAEEARSLDRALRSCKAISDIDRVWVRWSYYAESRSWLTDDEMVFLNGRYKYKKK